MVRGEITHGPRVATQVPHMELPDVIGILCLYIPRLGTRLYLQVRPGGIPPHVPFANQVPALVKSL